MSPARFPSRRAGTRQAAAAAASLSMNRSCWMLAGLQGDRKVRYYFTVTPEILARDRAYGCGSLISIGQWHRRGRSGRGMTDEAAFVAGVVATLSASRPFLLSQVRRVSSIPGDLPSEAFGGEARSGAPVMTLWIHLP